MPDQPQARLARKTIPTPLVVPSLLGVPLARVLFQDYEASKWNIGHLSAMEYCVVGLLAAGAFFELPCAWIEEMLMAKAKEVLKVHSAFAQYGDEIREGELPNDRIMSRNGLILGLVLEVEELIGDHG